MPARDWSGAKAFDGRRSRPKNEAIAEPRKARLQLSRAKKIGGIMKKSFKFFVSFLILNFLLVVGVFAEGYHVCVASHKSLKNAEAMVEKLEKQSIAAFVSESKVKNESYYRVLLSKEFKKIADARKYRDEVKNYSFAKELGLKDFWVCKSEKIIPKNSQAAQSVPLPVQKTVAAKKNEPNPVEKKSEPKPVEKLPEPKVIEKPMPTPKKEIPPEPLPIPEEPKTELLSEPVVKEKKTEKTPPVPVREEPKILDKNEKAVLSEEMPYSVLVRSYKYAQFAENDKARLNELGFDSYLLNTFDDEAFFEFNIHVGAFASREEAEELCAQFTDAGITDTEISDFRDVEPKIKKYDEIIASEKVTFNDGKSDYPTFLPESVEKLVSNFPANKDFPIDEVTIIDYDNYRAGGDKPKIPAKIFEYIGDEDSVHSALLATYRDELYKKEVSIFFANADSFVQDDALGEIENMQFSASSGVFDCILFEDGDDLVVYGENPEEQMFTCIKTKDFTKEEFISFLIDSFDGGSLAMYPQMRRTFYVLPDKNDSIDRDFVAFSFKKVGDDYSIERGYAEWSLPIVGHSLAKTYYRENGSLVGLGFYDLDYDFNAKKVHAHFMESKNSEISGTNQPVLVNNANGWYLVNSSQKEISFSTKSYVVAADTKPDSILSKEDLIKFGTELKIWDSEKTSAH